MADDFNGPLSKEDRRRVTYQEYHYLMKRFFVAGYELRDMMVHRSPGLSLTEDEIAFAAEAFLQQVLNIIDKSEG